MNIKEIKKLIKLVEESSISGLCVTEGENTIDIQKQSVQQSAIVAAPVVAAASAAPVQETAEADIPSDLTPIESPMVGVFYDRPTPDSDNYVSVGDKVSKGQIVCIVEAMKLFNEIESDVEGIVEKILVKNEEPVEFGQPLFLVRSS